MPISSIPNGRNFITKITTYKKICSVQNSMTILDDFIPIFIDMMNKKLTGRYNCTNPSPITHNDILELYKDIVNKTFTWENFTLEEQSKILLSERSNNTLDTSKLEDLYYIPNTLDSLKSLLIDYKRNLYI